MTRIELLKILNLHIVIKDGKMERPLIKGVNLSIGREEIVALVGGSGSGKTTLGLAILQLLPTSMAVQAGQVLFKGEDFVTFSQSSMRRRRGKEIAMIFQEPLSAFNPLLSLGAQIEEML